MFIGEYSHTIDQKGRLNIPTKFREALASGAVITRGLDQSLFLYTKTEWHKLAGRLTALPLSQKNARAFARLMLAGAMDVSLDKQGRIIIPQYLRSYGGLTKNCIIAGLMSRLEIWDRENWQEYKSRAEKESTDIAEQLGDLNI